MVVCMKSEDMAAEVAEERGLRDKVSRVLGSGSETRRLSSQSSGVPLSGLPGVCCHRSAMAPSTEMLRHLHVSVPGPVSLSPSFS